MLKNECVESMEDNARLAFDTLSMKPAKGIPQWVIFLMQVSEIEHFAGCEPGDYVKDPVGVYLDFQRNIGTCFIDQFIPDNPLTMGDCGFEGDTDQTAPVKSKNLMLDGIKIDSPEAVVEHMETYVFPRLRKWISLCDPDDPACTDPWIGQERMLQKIFGTNILKVPYSLQLASNEEFYSFPIFRYRQYGYENYFTAYGLYPEIMERDFSLQADLAVRKNAAAARAIHKGRMPPVLRLDHDMAGCRGLLVDIRSLDRLWFTHFSRSIQPLLEAGIRLLWHCDGNLMDMIPRLIDVGIGGFQGFQYEHGMDYEKICRLKDRHGEPLMIWAGVSVSTTLPFGTKDDIIKELKWLVEKSPPAGLCLGVSSSVTPGVKRENLETLFEGLAYYREHGRG